MLALRWVVRFIGLFSTIILARLLTPQDFGLVAMALVIYAFVQSLSNLGVDLAVIRDQSETTKLYDTAWTIQILQGIVVAIILLCAEPYATSYFGDFRLKGIFSVMALATVIRSFRNIGTVAFRKELNFSAEFRYLVSQKIIGFMAVVSLAVWLNDYRAIVFATLVRAFSLVILSYGLHPYRPKLSTEHMRDILGFSQWLLVSGMGRTLNEKSGQLIAGGVFSSATLGLYHISLELGTMFVDEIVMPVRRALFPNLSLFLNDKPKLEEYALSSVGVLALLCFPVGVGINIISSELVNIVLGEKWTDAIPLLKWLAIFGTISGLKLSLNMVLLVKGKPKLVAIAQWLEVAIIIPALILVSAYDDIEMIAITRVATAAISLPLTVYFFSRCLDIPFSRILHSFWRPFAAAAGMILIDNYLISGQFNSDILMLFLHVLLGLFSYCIIIMVLWVSAGRPQSAEKLIFDLFMSNLKKIRTR